MFLQISFTWARNRRGPNTLPCGTPDVTLTSSDSCPPTLTLCVRPKRNSLIHTTTLESTPEFAILVSSRPWGTKSKAFEKSTIIASILSPLSRESAMSWHTVITWLSHEYPGLNPCWPSYSQKPRTEKRPGVEVNQLKYFRLVLFLIRHVRILQHLITN